MATHQEQSLEALIADVGRQLYRIAIQSQPSLFDARGLRRAVLDKVLTDARLRSALFQFIDVLPELTSSESIAAHFRSYLDGCQLAGAWGRLLRLGSQPAAAWAVRISVARTARLFLIEEKPAALRRALTTLRRMGACATVDALGEAVLTEAEADRYVARYIKLLQWQEAAGVRPHLSLKLTALTPRFDPLDAAGTEHRVLARLQPLIAEVQRVGAGLTFDMEQYELKPLIVQLFRAIVEKFPGDDWQPGVALQAYLPETERDMVALASWARSLGRRISVRLVKGAYWDTEAALARQRRWPVPVFLNKAATDANYERLTRMLFEARDAFYPAIAGHNLRSLAHAIVLARSLGMSRDDWEIQMLHGMAEPLARAAAALGWQVRIYLPTGDLVLGIAYLIRRLLENTADTSILRQTFAGGQDIAALLAAPKVDAPPTVIEPAPTFVNTACADFSRKLERETMREAIGRVREQAGRRYPLVIHGAQTAARETRNSVNPARPDQILGVVELAGPADADQAVKNALSAFPHWRATPAAQRAELALRAAGIMLKRRAELAAWQVLEQGKNWREADADVAEAIDYLRYYAAAAVELAGWQPTVAFPGEVNHMRYEPRGVAAVIAPWNFPLAILAGMTSAALVTGNCAILKPAAPAFIVAHQFHEILLEAGFQPEVCQLLPGRGDAVGGYLVRHAGVHTIAFTGSREVGLAILQQSAQLAAGQTHLKSVVCEMGGKNAIIVDDDADLDEAVNQVMHSAFGYQGQKCSACSRLITVGGVHERFVSRLAAALESYPLGPPEDPQYVFGPMITHEAREKALAYVEIGKTEGKLFYQGQAPDSGFYLPLTIVTGIEPHHRLAREEIFGPVLAVLRARDFDEALDMALDSDYALTGGVFSRLPEHLVAARERFRVGNLYLNRRITGALVGVQPFGGVRLSGTGVQAGGPDYLKQFVWSRVVSENTMRHGFVPAS